MTDEQTCPYCGYVEEPNHSIWDEAGDYHHCTSRSCGKEYHVRPQYQFIGFETDKYCKKCNNYEEEGMCCCEEDDE